MLLSCGSTAVEQKDRREREVKDVYSWSFVSPPHLEGVPDMHR